MPSKLGDPILRDKIKREQDRIKKHNAEIMKKKEKRWAEQERKKEYKFNTPIIDDPDMNERRRRVRKRKITI